MKIMIFGMGQYYNNRKEKLTQDTEIVAFIDNNRSIHGQSLNGIPIIAPHQIAGCSYDKILLMSAKENEMKKQLLELGVEEDKIWYWERYLSEIEHGIFRYYSGCRNKRMSAGGKRVLIISTDFNYNGGSIAVTYAAKALQSKGFYVVLAARDGRKKFVEEVVEEGIDIVLCPALPYLYQEEICWIQQFDVVIVNTFQMIQCACEVSNIKPVVWWIHEPSETYDGIYPDTILRFNNYVKMSKIAGITIYAVSSIAQRNFNNYFSGRINKILEYGIPDKGIENIQTDFRKRQVFAVIGGVCVRKAQDIFIQAVAMLEKSEKEEAEFWLIGSIGEDDYGLRIRRLVKEEPAVQIMGLLTRTEMEEIYKVIDVVVCPSWEDPLPIVMTEGMMHGKVCIASDATGTANYIVDGENGLVCRAGDARDLYEKMRYVILRREETYFMRKNARKTYEKYFTMDKFSNKFERAVKEAECSL